MSADVGARDPCCEQRSNGYHVATDKAGAWTHRCRDAYDSTRHHVVDTYHGTTR